MRNLLVVVAALAACSPEPPTAEVVAPIVNGQQAEEGRYRWMASLRVDGFHFCGGTLIAPRWVLTAAHCVVDEEGASQPPDEIVVSAYDRTTGGVSMQLARPPIVHPSYDPTSEENDLALIELAGTTTAPPIVVNDDQRFPAAIPHQNAFEPADNTVAIGWGADENGAQATELREVAMPVIHTASCDQLVPNGRPPVNPNGHLCTYQQDAIQGMCFGDSGGPLIAYAYGEPIIVGISSWTNGTPDGVNCPSGLSVYTRVSQYGIWFRQQGVPVVRKSDLDRAAYPATLVGVNTYSNAVRTQHLFKTNVSNKLSHYWQPSPSWVQDFTIPVPTVTHGAIAAIDGPQRGNHNVPAQHVFARTSGSHLLHYHWINYGSWQVQDLTHFVFNHPNPTPACPRLDRPIASDPVAINGPEFSTNGVETQHVFARHANGWLIHYRWTAETDWCARAVTLGFTLAGQLAAVNGPERDASGIRAQHVFARTTTNRLVEYVRTSGTLLWTARDITIGDLAIAGDPIAVLGHDQIASGQRILHVFARGVNASGPSLPGDLIHYWWDGTTWQGNNLTTTAIGGGMRIRGNPVFVNGPNRHTNGQLQQHVFAWGDNNDLVEYFAFDGAWHYVNLTTLAPGGETISSAPVAILGTEIDHAGEPTVHVFSKRLTNELVEYRANNSSGWVYDNLHAPPYTMPPPHVPLRGRELGDGGIDAIQVFGAPAASSPHEYRWRAGTGWAARTIP